jgi:hypothetical protein
MRNLDQHTITEAVLARQAQTPDPRLKQIMDLLVRHLHAFAREAQLTEAEWFQGIDFLTRCGHITDERRQEFILLSDVLGLSMLTVAQNNDKPAGCTEATVVGPFHVPACAALPRSARTSPTVRTAFPAWCGEQCAASTASRCPRRNSMSGSRTRTACTTYSMRASRMRRRVAS